MKNNFILIICTTFISLFLLYFFKFDDNNLPMNNANVRKSPQEYMTEAFVTVFEEGGSLKEELSASHWAYLPETQLSTLTTPHLTLYKPDGTVWLIDAKYGVIKQPTLGLLEEIELQKEVVIKRPGTKTAEAITLETHKLSYHPKKQFAENNEPITLIKPGLTITGIGLRAFLDQGSVELLHNVKTYYTIR